MCMPQCKCSFHREYATWAWEPNMFAYYAKMQPSAISASHVITKYVPETHTPT